MLFGSVAPWVSNWLTPIWLIGMGALLGLVLLGLLWLLAYLISSLPPFRTLGTTRRGESAGVPAWLSSVLMLFSRRSVTEVPSAVREGVLWPFFVISVSLAVFGIAGVLFVSEPLDLLRSLQRIPYVGTRVVSAEIPISNLEDPNDRFSELTAHEVPVAFELTELTELRFLSDQDLTVAAHPFLEVLPGATVDVFAGEQSTWHREEQLVSPFLTAGDPTLYIRNLGDNAANLQITIVTMPPHPEVMTIPITACALVAVFLLYLLQRAAAPRLSAIALVTYKSEVAQPLFALLLCLGLFLLVLFVFIPYNTFGEDIKMLKNTGLPLIMVLGIVQAVWAAATSVSEEIEGRTALTVLSKPIGRRSFITGKFLGIVWTVALLFLVLGLMFLLVVAYKPIYDGREAVTEDATWQLCHLEMISTIPGLLLAFMETVVLASVSVAISTRLPMLANFVICGTIYILGHLTSMIVQSSMGQIVFVRFFGQLIATVFPVLDHFNIQAAVADGAAVSTTYLLWSLVYCLIYSFIALLLALILFEDRDLA